MFPVTITLTIQNADQLAAVAALTGAAVTAKASPVDKAPAAQKAEAPKQEAKASPKEEAKAPSTGTTSESQKSDAPSDTGASGKTWTLAECKQMTTDAVRAKKREEVVALLKEFGVSQTALLPEDAVQPFGEKLAAILNGAA
jgi:hypothetical protein